MLNYKKNFVGKNIKTDILSGFVVAIALIPEAIGFSFIAGVSPTVGLYTAFILGLITSLIGGKPGMISGATGAVAVVLVSLGIKIKSSLSPELLNVLTQSNELSNYILQCILVCAIIAGIIQIIIGLLRLGKLITLVPPPAMYGFVNGLAIVIALAQIPLFYDEGITIYVLVLITMLIIFFLPKLTNKFPAGLVAIIAITLIVFFFKLETKNVGNLADISGCFPNFSLPKIHLTFELLLIILPYAIIIALVGLIESLLTLSLLNEIDNKPGKGNQECIAQGVGNILCGFFGGMAGCTMIGQSIINFTNGGRGRLSSLTAAILLILFVVIFSIYISYIPVAVLIGIMFMVCINTFKWESLTRIFYMPNTDRIILIVVTFITVFVNLAIAIISGVIISSLIFTWKNSRVYSRINRKNEDTKIYEFFGPISFNSILSFKKMFNENHDKIDHIILDFSNSSIIDNSAAETIIDITKKYSNLGKKITFKNLSINSYKIIKNTDQYTNFNKIDNLTILSDNIESLNYKI